MQWNKVCGAAVCAAMAAGSGVRGEQFTWNNAAGGSYATGTNWTGTVSPAGTVPDDPATVLFNLNSAVGYTVNVDGNRDVGGFTVGNDKVTFNMDGANFSLGSATPPVLTVGTGGSANTSALILQSASTNPNPDESVFNTGSTMIGSAAGARGLLTVNAVAGPLFWNNHGDLTIGASGTSGSMLDINAGGTVTVDNTVWLYGGSALTINGGSLAMGAFARSSGSTFVWNSGIVQMTAAAVTVDAAGVLGTGSTLASGQELDALAGLTISAAGSLQLNGGTVRASTLANSGTFAFNSGALVVGSSDTPADVTIDAGGIFNSGNALSTGKSLTVTGTTTINAGRTLTVSGGTLNTGGLAIGSGGSLAFNSGTLALTATDLTIGPGGLLGSGVTLNPGRNLTVVVPVVDVDPGTTTIAAGGSLLISGGTFTTGRLTLAGGAFDFASGTFSLTFGAVTIDSGGMLGTSSTFGAGRNLNVSGAVIVHAGGTLTISGGTVVAGGLVNNGAIVFTSGTLAINGDDLQIGPGMPLGASYSVNNNMTLETDGGSTLDVNDGGVLTLNGGTVSVAAISFNGSGHLTFNTGTFKLTGSALTIDQAGIFGENVTVGTGQTVVAPMGTVITAGDHITVNGGRLATGPVSGFTSGLVFTSGEIDLTASTLLVGSGGLFGTSVTLPGTKTLGVSDTTTIASGGTLSLTGGTLMTAGLVNNGTLSFSSGTIHVTRDVVTIGSGGIYGLAATISAGRTLIVDTMLIVTNGQTLGVSGSGAVQALAANLGQTSSGSISQSGGSVVVTTSLVIGSMSGFAATYGLSGSGTLNAATVQLTNANGSFVQSGGVATAAEVDISAGHVLTLSGGSFAASTTHNDGVINETGGTLSGGLMDGAGQLTLTNAATASGGYTRQATLSIANTARVTLNASAANGLASTVKALTISGSGALDLNGTSMVFYSTSSNKAADYATLLALVKTGRSAGTWSGTGITSSAAEAISAAHGNHEITGIAVVRNDLLPVPFTTFGGVAVDANTILLKYTYVGDTNLDGTINIDDYLALDRGYLHQLTGWQNGDFTDNGVINVNDYAAIDRAFVNQGGGPLAAEMISEHTAEFGEAYLEALGVPEPGALVILVVGGLMMLSERRKGHGSLRR